MKCDSEAFYIQFHPQPSKSISGFEVLWYLLGSTVCCPDVRMPVILSAVRCQHMVTGSARSMGVVSPVETTAELWMLPIPGLLCLLLLQLLCLLI